MLRLQLLRRVYYILARHQRHLTLRLAAHLRHSRGPVRVRPDYVRPQHRTPLMLLAPELRLDLPRLTALEQRAALPPEHAPGIALILRHLYRRLGLCQPGGGALSRDALVGATATIGVLRVAAVLEDDGAELFVLRLLGGGAVVGLAVALLEVLVVG
jgi:hypothetical protein